MQPSQGMHLMVQILERKKKVFGKTSLYPSVRFPLRLFFRSPIDGLIFGPPKWRVYIFHYEARYRNDERRRFLGFSGSNAFPPQFHSSNSALTLLTTYS